MNALTFEGHALELHAPSCGLCGGDTFAPVSERMRHNVELPTVRCERCSLVQTRPRPTNDALDRFYRTGLYHRFHGRTGPLASYPNYLARLHTSGELYLRHIARLIDTTARLTLLDVGCGIGGFLDAVRRHTSWTAQGVEPYEEARAMALRAGHTVSATMPPLGRFDVVTMLHVLEHVPHPIAFVESAGRVLAGDGRLVVMVPDYARYGHRPEHFLQLPHLYSFTHETLTAVLERAGFAAVATLEGPDLGLVAERIE